MNKIKELRLLPVWVNPDHLVSTARLIMAGHKLRAIGVLEGHSLVGVLTSEEAAAAPQDSPVSTVMHPAQQVLTSDSDIRVVADTFVREGMDYAPVVDGDKFRGIVTSTMLLQELGRSYDPLTQLSWSDRLREWGVEHLKNGEEVTIIFIDVNKFGLYNKKYGHIVGDRVLQKLADFLRESTDPEDEVLVRYGGDEFAIGTVKHRDDAEDLADSLQQKSRTMQISETEEPITFSVGVFGGRRHRERENVHYQSTLDNLINIASRNCITAKQAPVVEEAPVVPEPPAPAAPSTRVVGIYADEKSPRGVTTVILSHGDSVASGAHSRADQPVVESVALATAKALERSRPGLQIEIGSVEVLEDGHRVRVAGKASKNGHHADAHSELAVEKDLLTSAAEATIAAFESVA